MKYARKSATKRTYKKKNSVYRKKYYKSNAKLIKDVSNLKRQLTKEKKNAVIGSGTGFTFAQFTAGGAGSGVFVNEINPSISQGLTVNSRIGDSIKVCSFCFQVEVATQVATLYSDIHYRIYLIAQPRNVIATGSTVASEFLLPNIFTSVIDYNSDRNYEQFKDFIVLAQIKGFIDGSKNDTGGAALPRRQHKVARKTNYTLRYLKGSATNILENSLSIIAVADDGDVSSNTGLTLQYSLRLYYYDS